MFGVVPGIIFTKVGFCGGSKKNPTYRSLGDHTECVQLEYDPQQTDYAKLLDIFWKNHDPTGRLPRQYMSAIFYHNEEQKQMAESSLAAEKKKKSGITTSILPAEEFYDAEDYHQKYLLQQHPALCSMLDLDPSKEALMASHVAARINGYVGGYGSLAAFEEEWPTLGISEKCAEFVRRKNRNGPRSSCHAGEG
ncbi:Peptide methionine sulfoxide reductase MsrA [Trinorchestia longiramus]|nr:Peptide methionine sulfoxide reductase MsrA [Trinorchestia longiramus]